MAVRLTLDEELTTIVSSGQKPRLLLHCCCAPCASYVLEYLSPFFKISILFFNPNIHPREEYNKRSAELYKLLTLAGYSTKVDIFLGDYDSDGFNTATVNLRDEPEGGARCRVCFELRLRETANRAKEGGFDYFATTLSVSPHKNAELLNEICGVLSEEFGIRYLHSDFKKRDGYKRSIELSKKYGLYRQDYCGCKIRNK